MEWLEVELPSQPYECSVVADEYQGRMGARRKIRMRAGGSIDQNVEVLDGLRQHIYCVHLCSVAQPMHHGLGGLARPSGGRVQHSNHAFLFQLVCHPRSGFESRAVPE
jgi:hypothetical protein